ncbi:hypothetical protein J7K55_07345 [Candidatus Aerophobetes bacterium]|nr:hypothetical protein [Candidatus Aerophobetes bacterium]
MVSLEELARIAEIEFSDIVDNTEKIDTKLRIILIKDGFVDVWLSKKLKGRFGFHWEQESTGLSYRYDNFPNTMWKRISTYPYHFHNGSQNDVIDSSCFPKDIKEGFRGFMKYVRSKIIRENLSSGI